MGQLKLKFVLIMLVCGAIDMNASPACILNDSIKGSNSAASVSKDTTDVTGRDGNNSTGANLHSNSSEYTDTLRTIHKKKDKRGVLSFTFGWQNTYEYLGSYYTPQYQYAYGELRYKFWFGLFGAVNPQFLFNSSSFNYVGTNFTVGFDNEWFRNFHLSFSYTYCAHQEDAVEALQDLWSNDFDVYAYYANKILTPEIRYDLTFGDVQGVSISNISNPGRITALGGDNVINFGLSHNFAIVKPKHGLAISLKIGDYINVGTANALLTRRVLVQDPASGDYSYVNVPYTGDKFSALNDEANLTIYFTWRSISINPYINLSIPFRNIAAEQAALPPVNINGSVETPVPDIVTNTFFYGGVTLVFRFPPLYPGKEK